MWENTDNDSRWYEVVEAVAKRLNMYCWRLSLSLYMNGIGKCYTEIGEDEQVALLKVLGWVGNPGQDIPMNLSLEQFLHVIKVWRRFYNKYKRSMFIFLNNVMGTETVDATHKKDLCRAMLEATIADYEIFGQEPECALEYIVLRLCVETWELRPVVDDFQYELVTSQFQNHTRYCREVSDFVKNKFGTAITLESTGGDFHNCGKTPLFVSCRRREYVLKPRNMLEEQCIDKMVNLFNETMLELKLPLSCGNDMIVDEHFTLVRKSVRQKNMTAVQAESYFQKVGALLFMIKLFGIEDIHMENMMTTDAGPVIIDGECLFYYNYLSKNDMYTGTLDYLIDAFNGLEVSGVTNNVSLRDGSDKQYAQVSQGRQLTNYGTAVVQGFQNFAAEIKTNKKASFTEDAYGIYQNMVSDQKGRIRVVPVKTSEWKSVFYATGDTLTASCQRLRNLVKDALPVTFKGTVAKNYQWKEDEVIDNLIKQSIKRGDVPFFYLKDVESEDRSEKKLGFILEETVICRVDFNRSKDAKNVFDENLDWLLSEEAVQSLQALLTKQSFPKRVDSAETAPE
jgi:hypothetical protein